MTQMEISLRKMVQVSEIDTSSCEITHKSNKIEMILRSVKTPFFYAKKAVMGKEDIGKGFFDGETPRK
mgnify:CR=1 FL=1